MGHGFWTRLSASNGSLQLNYLVTLLTALFFLQNCCIISPSPAPTVDWCQTQDQRLPPPPKLSRRPDLEMDFESLFFRKSLLISLEWSHQGKRAGFGDAGWGLAALVMGGWERGAFVGRVLTVCLLQVTFLVLASSAYRNGFWGIPNISLYSFLPFSEVFSLVQF